LFLIRKTRQIDSNGDVKKIAETRPLGMSAQVIPVAVDVERVMFPTYDSETEGKPLCQSIGGTVPTLQYKGTYSDYCVKYNEEKKRYLPHCSYADWTTNRKGEKEKPDCQEQFVIGVAVGVDGEMVLATAVFKTKSAQVGRTLIAQLLAAQHKGQALYLYPLELKGKDIGEGKYTYSGFIRSDIKRELTSDEVIAFMELEEIWTTGQNTRKVGFEDDDESAAQPANSSVDDNGDIPF